MDNKKNGIPKLRFPGFTGAWEQRKLGEVVERFDNLRIPVTSSKREKGITPYYGANGIQDYVQGYTHDGEFVLVAEDGANDLQNYPVHYVNGKVWVNNHAHVLQGKNKMVDNLFLVNAIKQIKIETYLVGGSRAKLNADVMMKLPIKVPTFNEQQKIGEYFSKFDTLITLHQRKLEHLQEQKKGLLQKMFPKNGEIVPEVRFPGFTDAWKQRKLGEVVKKSTIKNSDLEYSKDDILSVATMSDMNFSREINSTKDYMKTYNKILYGEIAFEGHSSKNYKFGRFVLNDYRNGIVSHIYDIYKITINYDMKFMKEWISLDKVMYKPLVNSTTNARMMNSLQAKNLYKQKVLLPNLQEQKEIGKFLKKVDSLIVLHQRKLDHLELMKKGLLQQMFV